MLIEDDLDRPQRGSFPSYIRTLITPTHRYTRYDTGEDGLYELHTDDDERTELGASSPAQRAEHVERLADALIAHSDTARGAPVHAG